MGRPTVWVRPLIRPTLERLDGIDPSDPYVRRFWTAAIGPGAVADLLRMVAAARRGAGIRHPLFLHVLVRESLAGHRDGRVWVVDRVPPLPSVLARRLSPGLRAEHRRWMERRRP
ncbi:MAG: hypothetical protein ACRDVM_08395 [Acidimicrobiia bacterium]